MASTYMSQTVAQLKELLKSKGLSTDGKKSDLVARLEESDASTEAAAPAEAAPVAAESTETKEAVPEPAPAQEPLSAQELLTEEAAPATSAAEPEPLKEEEKKELSDEEKKQLLIDLLTSKLKRAQKFGEENAAKGYELDLKRLEKFGLNPSSDLAFELGFGVRDKNFINKRSRFNGSKNQKKQKFRNRRN